MKHVEAVLEALREDQLKAHTEKSLLMCKKG